MTKPEPEILRLLLDCLDKLGRSAADNLEGLGEVPRDLEMFESMARQRQSAARAVLKSFKQIEDQLARVFRAIPTLVGEDAEQWYARDYADFMERAGVLDDAAEWSRVVKLRNQLVHDYPLDPGIQFDRLTQAIGALPFLADTHRRISDYIRDSLPGKLI